MKTALSHHFLGIVHDINFFWPYLRTNAIAAAFESETCLASPILQ